MDGNRDIEWLADQAVVAAGRLASVPTHLLGPAGRSLQAAVTSGSLGFQPPKPAEAPQRGEGRRSPKAPRSDADGAFQPSLMVGVPNSGEAKKPRRT